MKPQRLDIAKKDTQGRHVHSVIKDTRNMEVRQFSVFHLEWAKNVSIVNRARLII
jgi:hypothetical protein